MTQHDVKALIAHYVAALGEQVTGEPFTIELIDGPTEGTRLYGTVGWCDGAHWHVVINCSESPWRFWRNCLHEVGHVALGHSQKAASGGNTHIDRALIAGRSGVLGGASGHCRREYDQVSPGLRAGALGRAHASAGVRGKPKRDLLQRVESKRVRAWALGE